MWRPLQTAAPHQLCSFKNLFLFLCSLDSLHHGGLEQGMWGQEEEPSTEGTDKVSRFVTGSHKALSSALLRFAR